MKIICIYHSRDLDGWMSAAIVKYWYENNSVILNKDSIDFLGWDYGDRIPDLSEYDRVIMCDISFPKESMLKLRSDLGGDFIWIDHHASAIKELIPEDQAQPVFNGIQDSDYAACELVWYYFFPHTKMPELVRLLGRYDCFGHKGTDEERKVLEFQYGARTYIKNYIDAYEWLIDGDIELIKEAGSHVYDYLKTEAKQIYNNVFSILIGKSDSKVINVRLLPDTKPETLKNADGFYLSYTFLCVNRERFNPINFGIDYHKDGYDGFACFWYKNGYWHWSLYNGNGEVDVSQIARQYGGGGHKGAAGFVCDTKTMLNIIQPYSFGE